MLVAGKHFIFCVFCLIILHGATPVHASIRRYKFELTTSLHTRLCTNKTMLTINGQFPGPTIYARRGDLIIVDVINSADHIISLHWHGVKFPRNPWYDGATHVTQCPITPGNRFTQRILLSDEEGTLWWHAHSEWSRSTVHGAIVILPPKSKSYPFPKPHAEYQILIGEWWNEDIQDVYEEFLRSGRDPKSPEAFIINGLPGDLYPCSTQDVYKFSVEFGKTYLFRMINTGLNNIMFFAVANHNITVVGSEGSYTKPLTSQYISISPGQTIDFLLEANQPPSRYYMASTANSFGDGIVNTSRCPTTAYLEYVGNYMPPETQALPYLPMFDATRASHNFTRQLRSLANNNLVPKNVTENLFFALAVNLRPCGPQENCTTGQRTLASVNNMTFVMPRIPFLNAYYYNISGVYTTDFPDTPLFPYDYTQDNLRYTNVTPSQDSSAVKVLEYNSEVELVIQSTNLPVAIYHPIHLHGYNFYVVGSGYGNFNQSTDPANYNLIDPPLMDTIAVPSSGWTAIRFTANNPGVWFFHCHYERHQDWGMGMVFIVKDGKNPNEKMLPPPPDMPPCEDRSTLRRSSSLESTGKDVVS